MFCLVTISHHVLLLHSFFITPLYKYPLPFLATIHIIYSVALHVSFFLTTSSIGDLIYYHHESLDCYFTFVFWFVLMWFFSAQVIINHQVLPRLMNLLANNYKKSIKKEACWTLSNITAGNTQQIQVCSFAIMKFWCVVFAFGWFNLYFSLFLKIHRQ